MSPKNALTGTNEVTLFAVRRILPDLSRANNTGRVD